MKKEAETRFKAAVGAARHLTTTRLFGSTVAPVAIATALLCVLVIPTQAATITVTNTNDSGAGSLRQALVDANDGDTITFAVAGTIGLTSAELLVNRSITISGPGAAALAVNGNHAYRVFHIGPGKTVTISGLTITNGGAYGGPPDFYGADIYNDHAVLTVSNCEISAGDAGYGGGIYNNGGSGSASLEVNDCIFLNNSVAGEGGAIMNDGLSGTAVLTVRRSTFTGNDAWWDGDGGAICNYGQYAGQTGNATCTVSDSTISGNGLGGGNYDGGGIMNNGTLQLSNCTISGNSAYYYGAGILNWGASGIGTATMTLSNCTISGNSSGMYGGGIANDAQMGNAMLEIRNSTFTDNLAGFGGGIYEFRPGATVNLTNTILKAGAAGGNIANISGTVTSLGYNLSSDNGGGYLTGPGDQINTDPVLGPLQDNGGPTFTHELLSGSPAINAGDPKFTPPPYYDQRGPGFDRVVSGRVDIGSFEVQGPSLTPTPTPTPTPTATPTATPIPTSRPSPTPRLRPTPPPRGSFHR